MALKDIRIIADDRERKCGIPALLKKAGLNLEVTTLQVGDYIVSAETAVERKSIQDLVSSIFDGRLFDQCSRLREHFEHPALVVEGDIDELVNVVENPLVFYGALARVALDYNIPVLPTPDADHTARLLAAMATRRGGSTGPYLKKIRKHQDVRLQQLSTLSSLPGIGEKLADRILERFGTPLKAFNASVSELNRVPGMGRSRAERIKKILDTTIEPASDSGQARLTEDGK